jgi:hypothetical protein
MNCAVSASRGIGTIWDHFNPRGAERCARESPCWQRETVVTELDAVASVTLKVMWPEDDQQPLQIEYVAVDLAHPKSVH